MKVGDRVKISETSVYYNSIIPCNPKDIQGVIINIKDGQFCFDVKWDNGEKNDYKLNDLILVKPIANK